MTAPICWARAALAKGAALLGPAILRPLWRFLLDTNYREVEKAFVESGKLGLMSVLHNTGRWDRSNVVLKDGRIRKYDKREASS